MSFQAYLDTIKEKTGLEPADFKAAAEAKGLLAEGVKAQQIVDWLKDDYDLGRGHAMALVATFGKVTRGGEAGVDKHFQGAKAHWRETFDLLLGVTQQWGEVSLAPTNSYISLLRGKSKFAIVAITADRLDVGIKLKGVDATERFEPSGEWNSMVTHRVRITDPEQIDGDVIDWLKRAYEAAA